MFGLKITVYIKIMMYQQLFYYGKINLVPAFDILANINMYFRDPFEETVLVDHELVIRYDHPKKIIEF